MSHTYADLLAIIDAAEVFVDATPNACPLPAAAITTASSPATNQPAAKADDDPHRLASVNLERYATRNDGRTLAFWRDEWYVWKKNSYKKITKDELRAKLAKATEEEFDRICLEKQALKEQQPARDGDDQPIVSQKVSMTLVSNIIQATSGMVCISGDTEQNTWLPSGSRKNYISMANGIIDLDALLAESDDCLLPNSPQWFSFVSLPYEFDLHAKCPTWEAFLKHNLENDPERIKVVQEWAGYLLIPKTDEQKFMILEGEGKNGKSVFIAGLTAMLGLDNVSNVPLEMFGDKFQLSSTIGKLLNAAGDCGDLDKTAEGILKTFTGGERMHLDRKGLPPISFIPTARLMIACNNKPRFADHSDGVYRRMLCIPWRVEIDEGRRVKGMDKPIWWSDKGELPGMFLWAIEGLERLITRGGFSYSSVMAQALAEYKEEMNPARSFLQQNCEENSRGIITCSEVYRLYKKWVEENGYRPTSERTFGKEVKRVFKNSTRERGGPRTNRWWEYRGIQFSQEEICGDKINQNGIF
jgi:P4 family phage/plasmid primase-like protien